MGEADVSCLLLFFFPDPSAVDPVLRSDETTRPVRIGLGPNWRQNGLLLLRKMGNLLKFHGIRFLKMKFSLIFTLQTVRCAIV